MGCAFENDKNGNITFWCGDAIIPCKICGGCAENLCDYPIGNGERCDIELCEKCSFKIGENFHFCPVHSAEFNEKNGVATDIKGLTVIENHVQLTEEKE